MIIKFNNYIKESPDNIYINGKHIYLFDDNVKTVAFGYLRENKLKDKFKEDYLNKIFTTKSVHPVLINILSKENIFIEDDDIPIFTKRDVPNYLKLSGRLYMDYKIITFWDFPKNKEELKKIIEDLENKLNIKIWNNGWKIEIIEDYLNKDYFWTNDIEKLSYIPVEEYKGSKDFSEEERKKHLESPLFKKKNNIKGFGSLSSKGKQPLSWKQAKLKSEKLITNYNFFTNKYEKNNKK